MIRPNCRVMWVFWAHLSWAGLSDDVWSVRCTKCILDLRYSQFIMGLSRCNPVMSWGRPVMWTELYWTQLRSQTSLVKALMLSQIGFPEKQAETWARCSLKNVHEVNTFWGRDRKQDGTEGTVELLCKPSHGLSQAPWEPLDQHGPSELLPLDAFT